MASDPTRGNVLIFADDPRTGARLERWIAAAGETAVMLSGKEKFLVVEGDDDTIDLIVTDLASDDAPTRTLLSRLLQGDLFPDVPQLHLLRSDVQREWIERLEPDTAALAMGSPPPRAEFQAQVRLASEVGRLRRALARSSILDGMTRLYNRGYLLSRLDQEFSRARRHHTALSLVLFDIDQLHAVNDRFGQRLGDLAIFDVGQALRARVRRSDVFGRYGEDVFGVLLPDSGVRGAAVFANTVRTDVEERWLPPGGRKVQVRLSAGIATYFGGSKIRRGEQLLLAAELALREAKRRGGNRVFIHEDSLRSSCQHILIADPDPTLLGLAEDLLSMEDYQITAASTAEGVLAAAHSERPDLLIIDLQLAQAHRGPSVIERVRALEPDSPLPVIVMSAANAGDLERLARLGVDRYVTKPFSVSVLRTIARELFRTYQFEGVHSN